MDGLLKTDGLHPRPMDGAGQPFHKEASAVMCPTVILVCPHDDHRRTLVRALANQHATVVHEFRTYLNNGELRALVEADSDAVIVEIDTDRELALDLIENICSGKPTATVMAYSGRQDPQALVGCMRAGAREFLTDSLEPGLLAEALVRATARRTEFGQPKSTAGKLLVFWGSKGGVGVTTLASNFAIALGQESGKKVVLLDLNPCLGEVAIHLGIQPTFTVADALANESRLDREFVSTLLTEHSSGIYVLASRDAYACSGPLAEGPIARLVDLLRREFAYVVVDAGRGTGTTDDRLFHDADTIYVVAQLDVASLRNAQRFITHSASAAYEHLELVLNRFDVRNTEFDEARLSKSVGLAPRWKIPNHYAALRECLNRGAPLISQKNGIARAIEQMARGACGKPEPQKKKGFRLFG